MKEHGWGKDGPKSKDKTDLPKELLIKLISRLKILAELNIAEHHRVRLLAKPQRARHQFTGHLRTGLDARAAGDGAQAGEAFGFPGFEGGGPGDAGGLQEGRGEVDEAHVVGGDAAGFPNGRRPGDDVVDIELRVAMGLPCTINLGCAPSDAPSGGLAFTDGALQQASQFNESFPYLKSPIPGSPN